MKVLFLDHYGVMSLSDPLDVGYEKIRDYDSMPSLRELQLHKRFENFNQDAVNVLNSILQETNVEIIVSSDWKCGITLKQMQEFYLSQGILKPPLDLTPNIQCGNSLKEQRVEEILTWLKNHNNTTNWVCVDDLYLGCENNPSQVSLSNFVWTRYIEKGIAQCGIKEKIITYL